MFCEVCPCGPFVPKFGVPSETVSFCYLSTHFLSLPITPVTAWRAIFEVFSPISIHICRSLQQYSVTVKVVMMKEVCDMNERGGR